ncbi:hypothetical protein PENSPDRAFT_415811 [Peniophora sp. CONT]|nr:hypothetical protein PENSPDRAFT_415811 [Peniophora sp. CONT]
MPPSLMQRLMAEKRAGVELGKMRIYAQGTPDERRFLIFPRLDGSGKDDVYDVTIQAQPSSEFILSTRPVKQDPVAGERMRPSTSASSFIKRDPEQTSHLLSLEDDDKNNAPPPVQHAEFCGSVNLHLRALPISVGNTGRSMNPKAQPRHELVQNRTLSTPRHKLHRGLIGLPEGKPSLALPTAAAVKSGPKDKRARAPRNVVLDMIFDAFNEELKLTLKELLDVTGQPKAYLKSVLSDVAVLRSGTWQLKDEFARPKDRLVAVADLPAAADGLDEEEEEEGDMEEIV